MKKLIALTLIALMLLGMTACGTKKAETPTEAPTTAATEGKKDETPATTEAPASKYGGTLIVSQIGQQYEDNY